MQSIETAPSWPQFVAAKEAYEQAVAKYGAQSPEATAMASPYRDIENQCMQEVGMQTSW